MGKIGDLWVKLGLKNDEFKAGIADAEKSTEGFGTVIGKVKGVAVAAWAAIGAAAVKMAKDAVSLTQKIGDTWNNTMAGMRSAYTALVRQLASGDGWNNLFQNMAEAYRTGKEISAMLDEVFERKVSFGYEEAYTRNQISELNKIMRDQSKSDEEREAAAKRAIELEKDLGKTKQSVLQQEADAYRKQFMSQTGMTEDAINYVVRNYNSNRESLNAARDYIAQRSELERQLKSAQNGAFSYGAGFGAALNSSAAADAQAAIDALDANTSEITKGLAKLVKQYDLSNDDLVKSMADAEIAVLNVATETNNNTLRANSLLGRFGKEAGIGGGAPAPETSPELVSARRILDEMEAMEAQREADAKARAARMAEYWKQEAESFVKEMGAAEDDIQPILDSIQNEITDALNPPALREGVNLGDMMGEFINSAVDGLVDATQELADALANVGDLDGGELFKALLDPMLDTAKQMGAIMIKMAAGMIAVEKSIKNPYLLLVAGTALVAIAAAGKAALSGVVSGGTATTSTGTATDYGSQVLSSELTVYVKGTIKGSDIVLSGQNTLNEWGK